MSKQQENVIIFALARTGSDTLCDILNLQNQLKFMNEPFNWVNSYSYKVTGYEDLMTSLQKVLTKVNSIKHVWDPSGWPFQDARLNKLLVRQFKKVIFLNRKSVFQRLVSSEICQQSKIWHIHHPSQRRIIDELQFKPLNEKTIQWAVETENKSLQEYVEFFNSERIAYHQAYYEDIFQPDTCSLQRVNEILDFLELPHFSGKDEDSVRSLLNHNNKMITDNILSKIPNYLELKNKYAANESCY